MAVCVDKTVGETWRRLVGKTCSWRSVLMGLAVILMVSCLTVVQAVEPPAGLPSAPAGLFSVPIPPASAMSAATSSVPVVSSNIDTDIRWIRHWAMPDFRHIYDDYMQYAPAVILVGVKAGLSKRRIGRTAWGRMLVSDAFSVGVMAAVTNALKYSVRRLRPDGSRRNSFPSGHTATAFMTATMLHVEYGWKYPWLSFIGYTTASAVGVSRMMNNRHWMSDVVAGAVIGIGATHLGYFLADLIFKDKYLLDGYKKPDWLAYDFQHRYYEAGLFFSRRYVLGNRALKAEGLLPYRGSVAGVELNLPIVPRTGIALRTSVNAMLFKQGASFNMYNAHVGGFWIYALPKVVEFSFKTLIGGLWYKRFGGVDVVAEAAVALRAGEHVRVKALVDYEAMALLPQNNVISAFLVGYGVSWCF